MAAAGATAMAGCAECHAAFRSRTLLSVSASQQRISSERIAWAGGRGGAIRARAGSVRAIRLGPEGRQGVVSGAGLSSRSAFVGAGATLFYGCEGIGLAPSIGSRRERSKGVIVAQAGRNGVGAPERVLAALGYVLPFFDGIQYGRYFFLQYPAAEGLLRPLYPLLAAYKGFPYSNLIAFFSLYLLVVRNTSFSRYVRFNAMQAVVLDVLLILPTLVERTFAPGGGWGVQLLIIFYNTVFLFLVSCFLFGVISCILGKTPRLPIVADAADAQV